MTARKHGPERHRDGLDGEIPLGSPRSNRDTGGGMRRLGIVAVLVASCILLLGGCGSSGNKKTTTGASTPTAPKATVPTRAAYIAQGDALCKTFNAAIDKLESAERRVSGEKLGIEGEAAKYIPLEEQVAKSDHDFASEFRTIPQPPADHEVLEKIVAGHEASANAEDHLVHLLKTKEPAAYKEAQKEANEQYKVIRSLETGYGFKVCGEHGKSGGSSSSGGSSTAPKTLHIGESGVVGSMKITPTSFAKLEGSGEAAKWRLTMTVKNVGTEPVQPFCGGEATMTDAIGRVYEGEGLAGEANSENCGDKLQPGLSGSNYLVDFKAPTNTKPATVTLWGEQSAESEAKTWKVG